MRVLVEGEKYDVKVLKSFLGEEKFYVENGDEKGLIDHVGYFHSFEKNELVCFLPKVFIFENEKNIDDKKVLGKYTISELAEKSIYKNIKHDDEYNWIRRLFVIFYNSLIEYRKRKREQSIEREDETFELNTNIGDNEYTYLDLFLSFVNFHKKNKRMILFRYVNYISNQSCKVNWSRTVRKTMPFINEKRQPIYILTSNKRKQVNYEEELLTIFYSILNNFGKEHKLNLGIDKSFKIERIEKIHVSGLKRLRKIKHRYFSDLFRRIYQLCELYLVLHDKSSPKKKIREYIMVKNYNLVFEDMVDNLFSDEINDEKKVFGESISSLKNNKDGKIIDHLFEYASVIDTDESVFYIGDSKYYKTGNSVGMVSKYKQFTYARNIIQFNIDLWNKKEKQTYSTSMRYRDDITEGYNISPNFFIYGYVKESFNFDSDGLERKDNIVENCHFIDRLFDRDTLYIHSYKMNFLYIMQCYTKHVSSEIVDLRKRMKNLFRNDFMEFFNRSKLCRYNLKYKEFGDRGELKNFVDKNFRILNGKSYSTNNRLIVAIEKGDKDFDTFITNEGGFETLVLK